VRFLGQQDNVCGFGLFIQFQTGLEFRHVGQWIFTFSDSNDAVSHTVLLYIVKLEFGKVKRNPFPATHAIYPQHFAQTGC